VFHKKNLLNISHLLMIIKIMSNVLWLKLQYHQNNMDSLTLSFFFPLSLSFVNAFPFLFLSMLCTIEL
jgi:hypothetical protein